MSEERFEETLFLKIKGTHGEFSPVLLKMENNRLTISARIEDGQEPDYFSLAFIRNIDNFLHRTGTHTPSKKCENPEKIILFLK